MKYREETRQDLYYDFNTINVAYITEKSVYFIYDEKC
jgi:hypothetical protein